MKTGLRSCSHLCAAAATTPSTSSAISALSTTATSTVLFRFGVIADVQYADVDNVFNYSHTKTRYYRRSAGALKQAIDWWNSFCFIVNLGDLIDGRNKGLDCQDAAMGKVMLQVDALKCPKVVHMIGNHELYCFTRSDLSKPHIFPPSRSPYCLNRSAQLGCDEYPTKEPSSFYYSFKPADNWLVVVLDPYDTSVMRDGGGRHGYELTKDHGLDPQGYQLCQSHNPNKIDGKTDFFAGLTGLESRWAPVNGAVGKEQLSWLRGVLRSCHDRGTNVIILSHVILHPQATRNNNCRGLLWNYDDVLKAIYDLPCTRLVVCGHIHNEVYHLDNHGESSVLMGFGLVTPNVPYPEFGHSGWRAEKPTEVSISELHPFRRKFDPQQM
ncbi:hypothetical protein FOL47_009477 [Perkinsus chesapeaki]|uniref:Calcineurin-like phosphoesterase domain-containing protein n=1 Tax=Perkinsus chesapeaki TaxID=330153 RepID=A0A7J6L845_PERCH|nr:hypothetical protein FOL47_009477 [Perkinsus chesapeaki]